jgi:hypothetical protein
MATAVADAALAATSPTATDPHAPAAAAQPAGPVGQGAIALEGGALAAAVPVLLGPLPPSAAQALAVLGTVAVFFLLDLALACRGTGPRALPLLLVPAAAGLASLLGEGLPLLALLCLLLKLCAQHLAERSLVTASVLAATVAACRVDAGCLAIGHPGDSWLLLAVASLAAFSVLASARARAGGTPASPGANVRAPTRKGQLHELLLVALLTGSVAANFALLGSDARVHAGSFVGAFLPAPLLILGLFRCAQLAFASGGTEPGAGLISLRDPLTAVAALGWAAGLVALPWLPQLP